MTSSAIPSSTNSLRVHSTTKAPRAPRRRVRSESDRKKHAGWRRCPRCERSVSTNGRNFYHHMYKCDRVYFADLIAKVDSAKTPVSTPLPPAIPRVASSPITPPSLQAPLSPSPLKSFSQAFNNSTNYRRNGVALSEMQRIVYVEQLSFLRIYDRTVDTVISQLEKADFSVFSTSIFKAVRQAKLNNVNRSQQHHRATMASPYTSYPIPVSITDNPISLPENLPASKHSNAFGRNRSASLYTNNTPNTLPIPHSTQPINHQNPTAITSTNNLNDPQQSQAVSIAIHGSNTRQPSAMSISSVINN